MTWSRSPSPTSIAARYLAIVIVVAWTLVPAICGGGLDAGHALAHAASHDDVASHTHHDTPNDTLIECCSSLGDAKSLTAASAGLSPIKAVLIAALEPATAARDSSTLESAPAEAATGPPRTQSKRYLSYSPLAPPARTA